MINKDTNLEKACSIGAKYWESLDEFSSLKNKSAKWLISHAKRHFLDKFPEIKTVGDYLKLDKGGGYCNDVPHRIEGITILLMYAFWSERELV